MDLSQHSAITKRFAVPECMRPKGVPTAATTNSQTVTEAGYYKFTCYYDGNYFIVSDSTITSWPQYNTGVYINQGEEYMVYLEPGDYFRASSTLVLYQRFA